MTSRPPRKTVNLTHLPMGMQYSIAIAVVLVVVVAAAVVGRDRPIPAWASEILVPVLAWVFLAALGSTGLVKLVRAIRGPRQ